jgi:hypothetical protein
MSPPRSAYCTQQTGGLSAGDDFACNTDPLGNRVPPIPYRIDGALPHLPRPRTLRARRYRTFFARKGLLPPLCAGGADATWNMQWQTVTDGKAKDVTERRACGRQR